MHVYTLEPDGGRPSKSAIEGEVDAASNAHAYNNGRTGGVQFGVADYEPAVDDVSRPSQALSNKKGERISFPSSFATGAAH